MPTVHTDYVAGTGIGLAGGGRAVGCEACADGSIGPHVAAKLVSR